ncbi:hypothetical protein [uncultured Lacinutrix sp.]|jgi:hypothetical protein|uniref:hypothetical protein n=1 Tax=uncultured Lacinutrix sp. TaxID=574032 RepID=UPI0026133A2E|nr:hypothetical protein [uncultured Lacinutrix sp.]
MKKAILLLVLIISFSSCEDFKKGVKDGYNDATVDADGVDRTQAKDGLTTLSGEFSYYADAAVLQVGNSAIYGVVLNEKMHELHTMGKPYRTEDTDGVLVQVRGKIIPKAEGEEGWPFNIDIKEIISVKEPSVKNEVIKIGK